MDPIKLSFRQRVKIALVRRHMTREQLADTLGISTAALSYTLVSEPDTPTVIRRRHEIVKALEMEDIIS